MSLSRRDMMRLAAVGGLSAPASGWFDTLAARAAAETKDGKRKHKSCILLFMSGGPSHLDTFEPKPLLDRDDRLDWRHDRDDRLVTELVEGGFGASGLDRRSASLHHQTLTGRDLRRGGAVRHFDEAALHLDGQLLVDGLHSEDGADDVYAAQRRLDVEVALASRGVDVRRHRAS